MESDRIGLAVAIASVAAIAVIVFFVFQFRADGRVTATGSQSMQLAMGALSAFMFAMVFHLLRKPDVRPTKAKTRNLPVADQEASSRSAQDEFVAHLSHELKSPLNVLGLYSELLLSEAGKDEELRIEAANAIGDEVARLSSLINTLRSIHQIENGSLAPHKSPVRLRNVAAEALEEARNMAGAEALEFEFDAPKEMNPVHVDKDLMRIAITSLLSNAVKYNRAGGTVRLSIEETGDATRIRVADSGIGVSNDEAGDIFEKFYRSHDERVRAVGGHGLGLALTRRIVELHNGSLSLDRDRADGAEFTIDLWQETTAARQAI